MTHALRKREGGGERKERGVMEREQIQMKMERQKERQTDRKTYTQTMEMDSQKNTLAHFMG